MTQQIPPTISYMNIISTGTGEKGKKGNEEMKEKEGKEEEKKKKEEKKNL